MAFHDIIGQQQALLLLQKTLQNNRLGHAYLFHGPSGIGKKLTALQFVKALYCDAQAADACDTCTPCHKIMRDNHPDVVLLEPTGTSIGIDEIRRLQHRLGYKPYEGRRITVIIDACETFSLAAANALLKTLEEPPADTLLVLLTSKKDALPSTILSRCQLVPFSPLTPSHIETIFLQQGLDSTTAQLAASLAEGRLDTNVATDLATVLTQRQTVYTLLTEAVHAKESTLFEQARQLAGKRPQCEALLHRLAMLCRDLVMLKVAPTRPLYNHDLHADLATLAPRLSLDGLLDTYAMTEQLQRYLSLNVNPQLSFEHLVGSMQRAFGSR